LSLTVAREIACWFSNNNPACSKERFLLVASTFTSTFSSGKMAASRFIDGTHPEPFVGAAVGRQDNKEQRL
jgi:hypothetical protein